MVEHWPRWYDNAFGCFPVFCGDKIWVYPLTAVIRD